MFLVNLLVQEKYFHLFSDWSGRDDIAYVLEPCADQSPGNELALSTNLYVGYTFFIPTSVPC